MRQKATNLMTKDLLTVDWNLDLKSAYSLMARKGIRHLPVLNEKKELVGMLSDRDLLRAMHSKMTVQDFFKAEEVSFESDSKVRDYMSFPVVTVERNADIRVALMEILDKKISCVLVVDNQKAVGIITTEDLLRYLYELLDDKSAPKINLRSVEDLEAHGFWSQVC